MELNLDPSLFIHLLTAVAIIVMWMCITKASCKTRNDSKHLWNSVVKKCLASWLIYSRGNLTN